MKLWLTLIFLMLLLTGSCKQQSPPRKTVRTVHEKADSLKEAPMLAALVRAGKLPPLTERLPENPKVIHPRDRLGVYCDTWRVAAVGMGDLGGYWARNNYVSLVHWSMDWKSWEPGIAERWEVSPDGREFTFYLRKGLKFSDGHPFTADDVAFVFQHVFKNKKITIDPPEWVLQEGKWVKFQQLNRYAFKFTFPRPNGVFMLHFVGGGAKLLLPKHYLSQFIPPFVTEATADSIAQANGFSKWNAYYTVVLSQGHQNPDLPVLNPWRRITPRGKAETRWIFERNPYYYAVDSRGRQLPYFDRLQVSNVNDVESLYLKIITGEIDCQHRNIDGARAQLLLNNQEQGDYRVSFFPNKSILGIYINQTQAGDSVQRVLNSNKRFRLALSLGINREEIDKLLNWGTGKNLQKTVVPSRYAGDPELADWFRYDPVEANRILDSLGLVRGSDGWRLRSDQQTLALNIYIIEFIPIGFLELVREYWQQLGIKLNIKKMSYRSWWDFANSFKFPLVAYTVSVQNTRKLLVVPHHIMPYHSGTYWCGKWGLWFRSNHQAGEMPPPRVRKLIDIWEAIKLEIEPDRQQVLIDSLVYKSLKLGHTLLIKTNMPKINIIKNNFYNVSEGYVQDSWMHRGPAPDFPETYFME